MNLSGLAHNNTFAGTITRTRVDASVVEGSLDITTSTVDGKTVKLAGTFVAPVCPK